MQKKHRLEKSKPPPVVAVVTNMSYASSPRNVQLSQLDLIILVNHFFLSSVQLPCARKMPENDLQSLCRRCYHSCSASGEFAIIIAIITVVATIIAINIIAINITVIIIIVVVVTFSVQKKAPT